MASKTDYFLNKALGLDFVETLAKSELWKPATRSVNDIEDMKIGLQIVPRVIISFLIKELVPMTIGETKDILIPGIDEAELQVTKFEKDQYSGQINQHNKKVTEFKFRSIPSLGLVIMSAFELYDDKYFEEKHQAPKDISEQIHKLIDERMAIHEIVSKVIDKKMMERDAIEKLMLMKLTEAMRPQSVPVVQPLPPAPAHVAPLVEITHIEIPKEEKPLEFPKSKEKGSKQLKEFFAKKEEKKLKKNEFKLKLLKSDTVDCPDCGNNIFNGSSFSSCICYGDCGKVFLKKTEGGIKISFGKGWDTDNIEMLLEVLRRKRG